MGSWRRENTNNAKFPPAECPPLHDRSLQRPRIAGEQVDSGVSCAAWRGAIALGIVASSTPGPTASRDRAWIADIKRGDGVAFERLFRTYYSQLCDFAYRHVCSRDVAQELVHDVFAKLWEDWHALEIRDSVKAYLYAVLRNHAISHLRRHAVEQRGMERLLSEDGAPDQPLPMDVARQLEASELADAIKRLISGLPDRCQVALLLRWQRQLSYAEVADVMGLSVKTVAIYIARGLEALRQHRDTLRSYF